MLRAEGWVKMLVGVVGAVFWAALVLATSSQPGGEAGPALTRRAHFQAVRAACPRARAAAPHCSQAALELVLRQLSAVQVRWREGSTSYQGSPSRGYVPDYPCPVPQQPAACAALGCMLPLLNPCAPPPPPLLLQRELHELAGGHGPEFVIADHLPPVPGQQQGASQQQGEQDGAAAAAAAGGPVPMAE